MSLEILRSNFLNGYQLLDLSYETCPFFKLACFLSLLAFYAHPPSCQQLLDQSSQAQHFFNSTEPKSIFQCIVCIMHKRLYLGLDFIQSLMSLLSPTQPISQFLLRTETKSMSIPLILLNSLSLIQQDLLFAYQISGLPISSLEIRQSAAVISEALIYNNGVGTKGES